MRTADRSGLALAMAMILAVASGGCTAVRKVRMDPMPRAAVDSTLGLAHASSGNGRAAPVGDVSSTSHPTAPSEPARAPTADTGGRARPDSESGAGAAGSTARAVRPVAGTTGGADVPLAAIMSADTSAAIPPPPIAWDLDVESNSTRTRVTYFADVFSGRVRDAFQLALSRQTRFAPVIGERLRAGGLPQDLTYLALVESWYNPHAYSKAAAVGMWQFMAGTARGVGLRVDWWIDERRDPVRSTEGAVKLLTSLHEDFGSFFLAAAAYNGGSGRVSRGLTQFATRIEPFEGEDKFFALSDTRYLRPETRDYVPKMIAAALVAKQPDRYGLHVDSLPPFVYDSVSSPPGASLAAIAAAAPTDIATVLDLNPHILRGMVPPGESKWVRVPPGTAEGFEARYAALDSADRVAYRTVVAKKGDSMTSIARKHRLTAKQLNWYNPKAMRLKSGNLVPGQSIMVPTIAVAAAARDVPNPSIERYPRRRATRPASSAAAKPSTTKSTGKSTGKSTKAPATKKP
jgi:membrane-bound lytic murein transglycosylase D